MRRGCLLAAIVAGLAALPAPRLFAHGNEYLFARLAIAPDGEVVLELTADIANPLFTDGEVQVRSVLSEALRLSQGGMLKRLDEVGSLGFEQRTHYSPDSPLPPARDSSSHQLLTAVWRARLPGQTLIFATPQRTPHDVLLWQAPVAGQPAEWKLLICGEQSPAIVVPASTSRTPALAYWFAAALVAAALAVVGWQFMRTMRPTAT